MIANPKICFHTIYKKLSPTYRSLTKLSISLEHVLPSFIRFTRISNPVWELNSEFWNQKTFFSMKRHFSAVYIAQKCKIQNSLQFKIQKKTLCNSKWKILDKSTYKVFWFQYKRVDSTQDFIEIMKVRNSPKSILNTLKLPWLASWYQHLKYLSLTICVNR